MAFSFSAIAVPANSVGTTELQNGAVTEPKIQPAADNNLNAKRTARYVYDFVIDGGVAGSIPFRGDALPVKSIIVGGRAYVRDALTGAGGTTAGITIVAGDDLVADAPVAGAPWNTPDTEIAIIPVDTQATDVRVVAGGTPTLVVTTHDLTAGHVDLFVDYIVTD